MVECNLKVGDRVKVVKILEGSLDHKIPIGAIGKVMHIEDSFALNIYYVYNPEWVNISKDCTLDFWDMELEKVRG